MSGPAVEFPPHGPNNLSHVDRKQEVAETIELGDGPETSCCHRKQKFPSGRRRRFLSSWTITLNIPYLSNFFTFISCPVAACRKSHCLLQISCPHKSLKSRRTNILSKWFDHFKGTVQKSWHQMCPDCVWTSGGSSETQETFNTLIYGGSENKTVSQHSEIEVRICQLSFNCGPDPPPYRAGTSFVMRCTDSPRDQSMSGLM